MSITDELRKMAPTSDERRKVAERMRGPFDVCECVGHTYINGTLYGMQVCARDELALRDGMRRLADLIDPTCTVKLEHVVVDDYRRNTLVLPVCSACGFTLDKRMPKPNFCPECGARLVSDDG